MLPAPFYNELPADLGDEQTWAQQALDSRWQAERPNPPRRRWSGIVGELLVDSVAICLERFRRVVQR